jgi:iron complex transport system substrate-binding protein
MRIVSLLPAATEIVAALGGGAWLVGVSHECDFPPDVVRGLPRVTRAHIDITLPSGEIDRAVRAQGALTTTIDVGALANLRPDVVIGQTVCDVCAVGGDELTRALAEVSPRPEVVTLHAHTLDGVFADMQRVGRALGLPEEAEELVLGLRYRLRGISQRTHATTDHTPPTTLVFEWLDPPYVAGHWTPELVAIAGGLDVGNEPGARSVTRRWRDLVAQHPDRVIVALCGFDVPRARREAAALRDGDARMLFSRGVEFLDGNAYTSRPGPRLVDAAEQLALMLG